MVESAMLATIKLLFCGLVGVTIIDFALVIIILVLLNCNEVTASFTLISGNNCFYNDFMI